MDGKCSKSGLFSSIGETDFMDVYPLKDVHVLFYITILAVFSSILAIFLHISTHYYLDII